MGTRRGVFTFFFLLCLAAYLTGCGKSSPKQQARQKVLYTALSSRVRGMDPGDIGDVTSAKVAAQFFECLYQYHYLKRPYEPIPLLAESMPQVSKDSLTYTIKIKPGVYFADDPCFQGGRGRELVADDFVFAWKRIADVKNISKNWWVFDGKIVGLNEFREYTKQCKKREDVDYSRPVAGLQTPDEHTLLIKLKKPWPQIIYLLAHQPTAPMAKEAVDYYGKDIVTNPVGTGPFILKKWHRGSYIDMVRNPSYRQEYYPSRGQTGDAEAGYLDDADKKMPIVDRILWTLIEESQPAWFLFLQGKIDAKTIPKDNYGQVMTATKELTDEMKKRRITLKSFRDPSTFWLGFNMEDPVLGTNKALRKAISYAINREEYIDLFWNGRDEVAYGFVPPLMKAYNPEITRLGIGYDPDKAAQFVKDAKKAAGGTLPTLKCSVGGTDTLSRQSSQYYQRLFKKVGLDVEMEYMDWPTFLNKVKNKNAQMFMLGWIADYPDTENFLQLFYSKNASPGPNNFNYSNPEFDKLYEQVAVMPDSPKRTELYRKAELIIVEDCPAAFVNHRVAYVLHHDWIGNYKPHVFQYGLAKYRNVDTEKRKAYKELLKKIK